MSWNKSKSSTSSNPWAPAEEGLKDILGKAGELGEQDPTQMDTGFTDKMGEYYKNIMEGGQAIDPSDVKARAQEYTDPAMIQGMVDQNANMLQQTQSGIDTNSVAGGNMGSSRTGLAQASASSQASTNLNNQMLDYQNQQIDRASSELGAERDMQLGAGESWGQNQAQKAQMDYSNANAGWDQLQKQLGIVGAVGGMGGQGKGKESGGGFKFSDETLKKKIKKIGSMDVKGKKEDVGKYEYEATEEGKELGMPDGKQEGVLAQELKDVKPSAVKKVKGKLAVDYTEVEDKPKKKKKKKKKNSKEGEV
jgi:hypothetical protein